MSEKREITRLLRRMVASPFKTVIGRGDGVVSVSGKSGYVWMRRLGREGLVFQAYNRLSYTPTEGTIALAQESRIEGLSGYEIVGTMGGESVNVVIASRDIITVPELFFVRADKDGDLDYDPLTSTSWDGDAYAASAGTINWNTVFGVPTTAKAVLISYRIQDESAVVTMSLAAKSTTANPSLWIQSQGAALWYANQGVVPIASNGTSYYNVLDEMDHIYIEVVGWYL